MNESINGRPCVSIELPTSKQKVYLAEYLTVGEEEDCKNLLFKELLISTDQKMPYKNSVDYTREQVKMAIKKIVNSEDKEIEYSIEWYRNLPSPDLTKIIEYVKKEITGLDEEEEEDGKKKLSTEQKEIK